MKRIPDISVVVPTYNRQELLPLTLPALVGMECRGFTYEVILANDGSSDATADIIEDAVRKWPDTLHHLPLEHCGSPAGPRNVGIEAAQGRLIVLLDDDIVPDTDLLLHHFQFHQENPSEFAVAVGELYQPPEILKDPMSLFHAFPYHELRQKGDLDFLFSWTCNISAKADFLRQFGRFDEDPALHPVEDMEWGYRLMRNNMKLRFLPAGRGKHLHKMNRADVSAKGERTGRAQFALTKKVPEVSVFERFGIVSTALPLHRMIYRAMRRLAFRLVDNRLTLCCLKALGAETSERNSITDAYFYLEFRRAVVAGYKAAHKEHRQQLPTYRASDTAQRGAYQ